VCGRQARSGTYLPCCSLRPIKRSFRQLLTVIILLSATVAVGIGIADFYCSSHTTSSPSMAHERASSTLLKVVTFASRSFFNFFAIFSDLRPT